MAGRVAYTGGIVRNGLVLHLDAAKRDSYPKTGLIWYDISGNGNNGTLNGSSGGYPSFNTANGGGIVLDGTDDYISTNAQSLSNNPYSLSVTFKISSFNGSDMRLFGAYAGSTDQLAAGFSGTQLWLWNGSFYNPSLIASTNTIYTIDIVHSSSTNLIYINGVYNSTLGFTSYFTNLGFGNPYLNTYGAFFRGTFFSVKMYNRALSATEVQQNYNALKGRYI